MTRALFGRLEHCAERVGRPRWQAWAAREPALAGLGYRSLRRALHDGDPARHDELLAALVRLAQSGDQPAGRLLIVCLRPGITARVYRYQGHLDLQDAYGELLAGLWGHITRYDTQAHPGHVASRLLDRATWRLRRKAKRERETLRRHARLDGTDEVGEPGPGLPVGVLLDGAVTAGVITAADAALILAVDVHGVRLRTAARRAGCSYQAAVKRRQRAHARLATYLTETTTTEGDHAQPMQCRQAHPIRAGAPCEARGPRLMGQDHRSGRSHGACPERVHEAIRRSGRPRPRT